MELMFFSAFSSLSFIVLLSETVVTMLKSYLKLYILYWCLFFINFSISRLFIVDLISSGCSNYPLVFKTTSMLFSKSWLQFYSFKWVASWVNSSYISLNLSVSVLCSYISVLISYFSLKSFSRLFIISLLVLLSSYSVKLLN